MQHSARVLERACGEISTKFGAKFPGELSKGPLRPAKQGIWKSVWTIRRLQIPFPETQVPLRKPNLLCVELLGQWFGAIAELFTQHGWNVVTHRDKVAPSLANGSRRAISSHVASTAHLHRELLQWWFVLVRVQIFRESDSRGGV